MCCVRLAPPTVLQPISARKQRSMQDTCRPIGGRSLGRNNVKRAMQLLSLMGVSIIDHCATRLRPASYLDLAEDLSVVLILLVIL